MSRFFLIIGESLDEYQRELIHEDIKAQSSEWWHQHQDIWITDAGQSAKWWRERLGVITPKPPAAIFVLALPGEGDRNWSARGAKSKWAWLYKNYASPAGGPPDPNFDVPDPARLPYFFDKEPF